MDLRTKKTKRAIREAFLRLRAKKPLERITVKELAELAEISKATFYLHYQDIYDLSDQLQQEAIDLTLERISPEAFLSDPLQFMEELVSTFAAQRSVTQVLFSDSQSTAFPVRIEEAYKSYFNQHFPELRDNCYFQMFLTYQIYGAYSAFVRNADTFGRQAALDSLRSLSKALTDSPEHRSIAASFSR